jgi:hypothetical protein
VLAEYVTLDLNSQEGPQGQEVDAVLQAIGRCGTVSGPLWTPLLCRAGRGVPSLCGLCHLQAAWVLISRDIIYSHAGAGVTCAPNRQGAEPAALDQVSHPPQRGAHAESSMMPHCVCCRPFAQ